MNETPCVSNDFRSRLTRNPRFSRAFRKEHAKSTIARLLSEKTICNAPFLVCFLKSKRELLHFKSALSISRVLFGFHVRDAPFQIALLAKQTWNCPFQMFFLKSRREVD